MSDPYDQLDYPSVALPQTHPDRLAAAAILHGMRPAVETCRVLDLGCGDGLNLVAIAVAMPQAQCLGIDLAARPIVRGVELIRRVGIGNATLQQMDLMDIPEDLGTFDYIIAHGLYSWVPPSVRDRLLEICQQHLAPQGVAYVSYNAYPGAYLRQMCRRMMLFHIRNIADPKQRVPEVRKLLSFLVRAHQQDNPIAGLLKIELERIAHLPDGQVFHDDLAPVNDPVQFDEFADHAARHSLQFLADADLEFLGGEGLPAWMQQEVNRVAGDDVVAREVYIDFLRDAPYRQTLLCHGDMHLTRPPALNDLRKLWISYGGSGAATGDAITDATLAALKQAWPRAMQFDELAPDESRAEMLARVVLSLSSRAVVQLHARQRAVVLEPAQCPRASPLARVEAQTSDAVTTLNGHTLRLAAPGRRLLQLLDGTRDAAALTLELAQSQVELDAQIRQIGRAGLLVA